MEQIIKIKNVTFPSDHPDAFLFGDKAFGEVILVDRDPGKAELLAYNRKTNIIAYKIKGHSYWSSRSEPTKYAPAEFVIAKIEHVVDDEFRVVKQIISWSNPSKA